MRKKPTISVDAVQRFAAGRRVTVAGLREGYAKMAADKAREAEALEWIEGLVGDVANDPR